MSQMLNVHELDGRRSARPMLWVVLFLCVASAKHAGAQTTPESTSPATIDAGKPRISYGKISIKQVCFSCWR